MLPRPAEDPAITSRPERAARHPDGWGPRQGIGLAAAAAALAALSCAPPPALPPAPSIDASGAALALEAATRPEGPVRVVFEWTLNEQGSRVRGRGVARLEPPYRARLDLFLRSGETAARAAMVRGDLRLPPGTPAGMIPPPHLLWASLGVFRPGPGAALLGAEAREGDQIRLRYGAPGGEEIHYLVSGNRLLEVELLRGGHVVERVVLTPDPEGPYPRDAVYRNLSAFRELSTARESVEHVDSFPPDIWLGPV